MLSRWRRGSRKASEIDRFGLTRQRLKVLVALGQVGAVSKGRMADYAGCGTEELEKFVMPALLLATTNDPAMVSVTNKGYAITWRGIEELDRRGIPHRGAEVVVGGHEKLDFGAWDSDGFGAEVDDQPAVVVPSLPKRRKKRLKTLADYLREAERKSQRPCLPVITLPTITVPSMALPVITPPPLLLPAPKTFVDICRDIVAKLEK